MPVETVGEEIRVRVRMPGEFIEESFRQLWPQKRGPEYPYNEQGIRAIGGKLKDGGDFVEQSIRFSTDEKYGWTEAKAETWVREHGMTPKSLAPSVSYDFEMSIAKGNVPLPDLDVQEGTEVLIIEGAASTDEKDRQNEKVEQVSIQTEDFQRNPVILLGHDPNVPIGRAVELETDVPLVRDGDRWVKAIEGQKPEARGLWAKVALIGSTQKAKEAIQLAKNRILRGFSIRGQAVKRGMKLLGLKLVELSVVTLPANQGTLFEVVSKSFDNGPADPEPEVLDGETKEKEDIDMADQQKQELPPDILQRLEAIDGLIKRVEALEQAVAALKPMEENASEEQMAEEPKQETPKDAPKADAPAAPAPAPQVVETREGVKKSLIRESGKKGAEADGQDVVKGLSPERQKLAAEVLWRKLHPQ